MLLFLKNKPKIQIENNRFKQILTQTVSTSKKKNLNSFFKVIFSRFKALSRFQQMLIIIEVPC
jgi:hypothetical protein